MNKLSIHPVIIFTASFAIVILIFYLMTHSSTSEIINNAATRYAEGETATTVFERQQNFNNALQLYLDLEKTFDPRYSNGKLYYNIGNTFYQLGEYPFAILYYTRALALNGDARIRENLQTAQEKAHVKPPRFSASIIETLSLNKWLSVTSRLQFFGLSALGGFVFLSLFIWWNFPLLRVTGLVFSLIAAFFLLTILLDLFFGPQEAVLINGENLRKGASVEFASVIEEPLSAGTVVRVIGQEKEWLKVVASDDKMGFVPEKSLRKI